MGDDVQLTQWYLVRHAAVKNSRKGIYKNADAAAQLPAKETVAALATQLPQNAQWYVSPMARTQTTANALLNGNNLMPLSVTTCDDITEQDFGRWQGLSFEQIWQQIKDFESHNWSLLAAETTPPEGESFVQVRDRVKGFIDGRVRDSHSVPQVLVTHAGVIRAFVGQVLGLDINTALALHAEPFSLTQLVYQTGEGKGGKWQLQYLNRLF